MSNNATRYARHHAHAKRVGQVFVPSDWLGLTPAPIDAPAPVPGVPAPLDLAGRKPIAYAGGRYIYDEVNVICSMPAGRGRVRYERWIVS